MQLKYELSLQALTPGPANGVPVYVLAQVLPPSVDLKILLVSLCGKPPPPSSMPAMYTLPVAKSPVIWTSRMKLVVIPCWVQVLPLSVDTRTWRAPPPTLKSFQETYMFPKCGEEELLSAQPDSRSSPPLVCTQKWVQLFGSSGVVDSYPPKVQLPFASSQTVNHVWVGLLYRITGSPKVL